jgi:hypothetical protein
MLVVTERANQLVTLGIWWRIWWYTNPDKDNVVKVCPPDPGGKDFLHHRGVD